MLYTMVHDSDVEFEELLSRPSSPNHTDTNPTDDFDIHESNVWNERSKSRENHSISGNMNLRTLV